MAASIIATLLLGFGASCLFVWTLMPVARRIGLVDHPGGRKTYDGAVPTIGGLAIVTAVTAVIATALVLGTTERVHPAFWAGPITITIG